MLPYGWFWNIVEILHILELTVKLPRQFLVLLKRIKRLHCMVSHPHQKSNFPFYKQLFDTRYNFSFAVQLLSCTTFNRFYSFSFAHTFCQNLVFNTALCNCNPLKLSIVAHIIYLGAHPGFGLNCTYTSLFGNSGCNTKSSQWVTWASPSYSRYIPAHSLDSGSTELRSFTR